jgi:hypothetical protein
LLEYSKIKIDRIETYIPSLLNKALEISKESDPQLQFEQLTEAETGFNLSSKNISKVKIGMVEIIKFLH